MKKRIIVNLKEGVDPHSLFQNTNLPLEDGEKPVIKPVYTLQAKPEYQQAIRVLAADSDNDLEKFHQDFKNSLDEKEKSLYNTFEIELPDAMDASMILKQMKEHKDVNFAQVDQMNALLVAPNDPLYADLYGLKLMQCEQAWEKSEGEGVVVAVVDTGVDYEHPDIRDNMWKSPDGTAGYNFSEENSDPMDYHSHGTHVSGTIASMGYNSIGIIGVAYRSRIMALKVFPNASDTVCSRAIKYAVDHGAKVINNSWGPTDRRPENPLVEEAIDYAVSRGATVVFAAGNNADDVSNYAPANSRNVVCVAATDKNDQVAGFSNFGDNVLVAAPGKDIVSLKIHTDQYTVMSGTSMAAPHVSGLAALILSKDPNLTLAELKDRIRNSADAITANVSVGSGRINALKALQ